MNGNFSVVPEMLKSNPQKAMSLIQGFMQLNAVKLFNYNFSHFKSSVMPLMTFKITPLCNLRCVMCGQRGVTGTLKGKMALDEEKKLVSIERYKQLTDEVAGKTKIFYIWGGEPFLYPGFTDLVRYMVPKIPVIAVNTNGTYLEDYAEEIVRDKWTTIFISLDGFEDTNDKIRGKGSYQKVMAGIEKINQLKAKYNSVLPYLGVVTTVSNLNYMYLDKLSTELNSKKLTYHVINLGTYMTQEIGEEHTAYVKEHLDVDWTHWKGFTSGYNEGIDGDKFKEILKRVHAGRNGHPIITVPVIEPDKINKFYTELKVPVRNHCATPWFSTNINYDGTVGFCADYPDYIIGNIKENSLWELYNNEKAVKFRKVLKESPEGLFPACKRCYQIMLCGEKKKGF